MEKWINEIDRIIYETYEITPEDSDGELNCLDIARAIVKAGYGHLPTALNNLLGTGTGYQQIVNEFVNTDWTLPTKLYIVYELTSIFEIQIDDDLVDKLFNAYMVSKYFNNVASFVRAIYLWCCNNETDFDLIEDYDKMLNEINQRGRNDE